MTDLLNEKLKKEKKLSNKNSPILLSLSTKLAYNDAKIISEYSKWKIID